MSSSPLRPAPGASPEELAEYYKKSYAQLEADLADYQASSKELEEQLERDVENAEKNERKLREQIEKLKYEADEWKMKHQNSKSEANNAQNSLQKEITAMRETNRTMQLKLRDTEVMNDDYERQARNTESSLEDMEGKYNVAIERGVLLESEVKIGEQERESLRIENQRLRDELSELKVESEITLEKLRAADDTIERLRSRKPSPLAVESLRARSPGSEASGITPSSSTASTPPPKSDSASDAPTPPSPPLSDTAPSGKPDPKTPISKRRSLMPNASATPRPGLAAPKTVPKHSRGPSTTSRTSSGGVPTSDAKAMRPPMRPRQVSRPSNLGNEGLPRSDSLYQIRSLRGRMQKIEERVQSARSKLPAPRGSSTPKGSPRAGGALGDALPASVTMRRSVRRPPSNIGSQAGETSDILPETPSRRESTRLSTVIPRPLSVASDRLSIGGGGGGIPRPTSVASERPPSALDRPPSAAGASRPSSRASLVSGSASVSGHRPGSRIGSRTPVGDYAGTSNTGPPARPRSSIAGNYATVHGVSRTHRPSASITELRRKAAESEDAGGGSPGRRGTIGRSGVTATHRQSGIGLPQPKTLSKRTSIGFGASTDAGAMRPPPKRPQSDLGETY